MSTERTGSGTGRWRRPLALVGLVTLVVAACGGSTTASPSAAAPSASAAGATASPAGGSAAPAASDAGYTGPEATISYSIWGDPQEIKAQQAIVDAFHEANPKITVKVTVSDWEPYWDKLQTSIAGGDAPDVFAMDGPLFPDYQTRDVLLDLKPFIDRDGYDLGQLADQAVADFTTPDGQFGLPRDLNVVALYYNKAMFDAAGIPYPDDTWDWAKLTDVAKKLTLRDASGKTTQWGFYTESTDMENFWSEAVWQNGGDIISPDHKTSLVGSDQAAGGIQFLQDLIWKDKVMPDAAITDALGDAFEQGQAAMESNGSWLVATHQAAGIDFGIAPLPKGPAGQATSINPTGAVVYKGTKNPDAAWAVRQVPRQPGGPDQDHGPEGVDAGQQGGPQRTVRDVLRWRSGPRRRHRLRPHQALVQGLHRVDDRAPDGTRHQRLHRCEQDGQAGPDRRAAPARRDPRQAVTSIRRTRAAG